MNDDEQPPDLGVPCLYCPLWFPDTVTAERHMGAEHTYDLSHHENTESKSND